MEKYDKMIAETLYDLCRRIATECSDLLEKGMPGLLGFTKNFTALFRAYFKNVEVVVSDKVVAISESCEFVPLGDGRFTMKTTRVDMQPRALAIPVQIEFFQREDKKEWTIGMLTEQLKITRESIQPLGELRRFAASMEYDPSIRVFQFVLRFYTWNTPSGPVQNIKP